MVDLSWQKNPEPKNDSQKGRHVLAAAATTLVVAAFFVYQARGDDTTRTTKPPDIVVATSIPVTTDSRPLEGARSVEAVVESLDWRTVSKQLSGTPAPVRLLPLDEHGGWPSDSTASALVGCCGRRIW